MTDIVERLRVRRYSRTGDTELITLEAAAEIEKLRAALEDAKTALAPLATRFLYPDDIGADYAADLRSDDEWDEAANEAALDDVWIARGDVRRARAALEGKHD